MFLAHVKGLGFIKFLSVDGGISSSVFFTHDFEQATNWETVRGLNNQLNGEISSGDMKIIKIEIVGD